MVKFRATWLVLDFHLSCSFGKVSASSFRLDLYRIIQTQYPASRPACCKGSINVSFYEFVKCCLGEELTKTLPGERWQSGFHKQAVQYQNVSQRNTFVNIHTQMRFWLFYLPLTIYYTVTLAYSSDMCWRNFSINVLPTPCLMMRIILFFLKKAISIKCWEWIQGVSRVSKVKDKERIQTAKQTINESLYCSIFFLFLQIISSF